MSSDLMDFEYASKRRAETISTDGLLLASVPEAYPLRTATPFIERKVKFHSLAHWVSGVDYTSTLPSELLHNIFQYLPLRSKNSVTRTCKTWNRAVTPMLYKCPILLTFTSMRLFARTLQLSYVTHDYNSLVRKLDFAILDEHHRNSYLLSTHFTEIITYLTGLRELNLSFCKGVSNYDLIKLALHFRQLQKLDVSGGGRTDVCAAKLLAECINLTHLNLGWNNNITDLTVREIANRSDVSFFRMVDDNMPKPIICLDLTYCNQITDESIKAILSSELTKTKLQKVSFCYCMQVSSEALRHLIYNCEGLQELWVRRRSLVPTNQ